MKHRGTCLLLVLCASMLAPCGVSATGRPNSDPRDNFYFASQYRVSEDVGEVLVRVGWIPYPGNTNGWVLFRTLDGSALAGFDFISVSRTLYFSPATNIVSVPVRIILDQYNEEEEYLSLNLAAGYSSMQAVWAPLRITNVRVGPKLTLAFADDGSLSISWRDDGITRVLEKATTPSSGDWIIVNTPPFSGGGFLSVSDGASGSAGFYRLRKVD